MKSHLQFIAISICVLLAASFSAVVGNPSQSKVTKVKRKNGQVVEGEIKGFLVQKGNVEQSMEGSKTKHTVSYEMVRGEDIELVDENGVHTRGGSLFINLVASKENIPPDDLAVLVKGQKNLEFQLRNIRENALPIIVNSDLPGGSVLCMFGKVG